ncbi:hypothetical protein UFOVP1365_38 [uncultured Caudovirales phage]|uniref:Uncharacterized protein n=1 Tax=uncultured Caudovirales phage TaxID=2100421 RepID=A0A6J5RWU1_9CAUD|nr:hypothetical protein UFOVP1365_38 [uncultured Caudovirales phage]
MEDDFFIEMIRENVRMAHRLTNDELLIIALTENINILIEAYSREKARADEYEKLLSEPTGQNSTLIIESQTREIKRLRERIKDLGSNSDD